MALLCMPLPQKQFEPQTTTDTPRGGAARLSFFPFPGVAPPRFY